MHFGKGGIPACFAAKGESLVHWIQKIERNHSFAAHFGKALRVSGELLPVQVLGALIGTFHLEGFCFQASCEVLRLWQELLNA